jgi:hypothetical protein
MDKAAELGALNFQLSNLNSFFSRRNRGASILFTQISFLFPIPRIL